MNAYRWAAAIAALGALPLQGATCESLSGLPIPHVVVTAAQSVAAGTYTPSEGRPIPHLPAFCRVAGSIHPADDSDIRFEVWLPSDNWNGKLEGIGNGGFAGSLSIRAMAPEVIRGYATATTDTGHDAAATPGATWALGHPQKVIDFGYRAIHETAVVARALIAAFYGRAPRYAYFNSCSNGGRQALMEAERFPEDYNGIVAGAPADYWTHLLSAAAYLVRRAEEAPAGFIPPTKIPALESAVLAACDALDGLKDGLIDDPRKCHFDPATLLCHGADTDRCLTAPQVNFVKSVYGGLRDSKGSALYDGTSPGGEGGSGGWVDWITGTAPHKSSGYGFGTQFFSRMVYEDAQWDPRSFNPDLDMRAADTKLAGILNSNDPDLSKFRARGGKLILYHGWSDAAIPPVNAIHYYDSVRSRMGAADTDGFVRLYMVPGMQHCGGGPGPNFFWSTNETARGPADTDMQAAIEHWVEDGAAPQSIQATKFKRASNPDSGVQRTRPLCPYPQTARWKGTGSIDEATNFACVQPQ